MHSLYLRHLSHVYHSFLEAVLTQQEPEIMHTQLSKSCRHRYPYNHVRHVSCVPPRHLKCQKLSACANLQLSCPFTVDSSDSCILFLFLSFTPLTAAAAVVIFGFVFGAPPSCNVISGLNNSLATTYCAPILTIRILKIFLCWLQASRRG